MRRVIGDSFDVYFHLWSTGAPHWEREKRLWEAEEAKKWTTVCSSGLKKTAKSKSHSVSSKRVRFAPQIVSASPVQSRHQSILFGAFRTPVNTLDDQFQPFVVNAFKPVHVGSSSVNVLRSDQLGTRQQPTKLLFPKSTLKKNVNSFLGPSSLAAVNSLYSVKRGYRELVPLNSSWCSRCLRKGHSIRMCQFTIRCLICFNYGHRASQCISKSRGASRWKPKSGEFCYTKSSPRLCWKPKAGYRGPNSKRLDESSENAFTPSRESQPPIS